MSVSAGLTSFLVQVACFNSPSATPAGTPRRRARIRAVGDAGFSVAKFSGLRETSQPCLHHRDHKHLSIVSPISTTRNFRKFRNFQLFTFYNQHVAHYVFWSFRCKPVSKHVMQNPEVGFHYGFHYVFRGKIFKHVMQ